MAGMSYHDLPEPPPALLQELDAVARERLLELWANARGRQHEHLTAAVEQILQSLPRILRGAVRRVLI